MAQNPPNRRTDDRAVSGVPVPEDETPTTRISETRVVRGVLRFSHVYPGVEPKNRHGTRRNLFRSHLYFYTPLTRLAGRVPAGIPKLG